MDVMYSKNTISVYVNQFRMMLKTTSNFFSMFGVKQLFLSPTRMSCGRSSITDRILPNFHDRVTKQGILNVGLSDHHLIYCTRKITRVKRGGHKEIKLGSLKNYTFDVYEKPLGEIKFHDYENFDNVNGAYTNFIQKKSYLLKI